MRDQRIRRQKRRGGVFRRRPFLEIDRLRQAIAARLRAGRNVINWQPTEMEAVFMVGQPVSIFNARENGLSVLA